MRPLFADCRRTLLVPLTIGTIVFLTLAAGLYPFEPKGGIAYPDSSYAGTLGGFSGTVLYSQGYEFEFYDFDALGHPVSGVEFTVTLSPFGNFSGGPNFSAVLPQTGYGLTNSSGRALVPISIPDGNYSIDVGGSGGGQAPFGSSSEVGWLPPGTLAPGVNDFGWIGTGPYGLVPEAQVFFGSPTGGPPPGLRLVVQIAGTPFGNASPPLTTILSDPVTTAVSTARIDPATLPNGTTGVYYTLEGANGTPLAQAATFHWALNETNWESEGWGFGVSRSIGVWSFVAPLAGVLLGYASYGRDRRTRALEPVTALSTTREGILLRRYLSALLALAIGVALAIAVTDANLASVGGFGPSAAMMTWLVLALLGEALAFLGLTYLLSRLFRSGTAVVGIAAASALTLTWLWVPLLQIFSYELGWRRDPPWLITAENLSPGNIPLAAVTDYFARLGSPPGAIGASDGVLYLGLAVTVLLATALPLGAAVLARIRD